MSKTKVKKRQGFEGGSTRGLPSQDSFRDLLYAAYNIGPTVTSDAKKGQAAIEAANSTAGMIFTLVDTSIRIASTPEEKRGVVDGVVTALRLLAETTCAKDPEEYAVSEARKANDGGRHEDYGATIELPSQAHGA